MPTTSAAERRSSVESHLEHAGSTSGRHASSGLAVGAESKRADAGREDLSSAMESVMHAHLECAGSTAQDSPQLKCNRRRAADTRGTRSLIKRADRRPLSLSLEFRVLTRRRWRTPLLRRHSGCAVWMISSISPCRRRRTKERPAAAPAAPATTMQRHTIRAHRNTQPRLRGVDTVSVELVPLACDSGMQTRQTFDSSFWRSPRSCPSVRYQRTAEATRRRRDAQQRSSRTFLSTHSLVPSSLFVCLCPLLQAAM